MRYMLAGKVQDMHVFDVSLINPNDREVNKQAFAFVLRRLMEISVCDQTALAELMDKRYNEWVRENNLNKPLRKEGKEVPSSQNTISKWTRAQALPDEANIRFLVQGLIDWWYGEEVRESCEVAGYQLPPFKQFYAEMLFRLSGHQPPWELDAMRQRITDELSSDPDPIWEQQRAVVAAAKQLRRKSEKLTELSPVASRVPTTSKRLPALRKNRLSQQEPVSDKFPSAPRRASHMLAIEQQ